MLFDQINLSTRERIDYRIRYFLYGGTAVFVAIITLVNLVQGYQLHRESVAYGRKLTALQGQARKLKAGGDDGNVNPKVYQALMQKGLKGNRLIALDRFPWAKVLDALEKALPEVVIIDSFRPVDGFTRIHLAGRTDSLEKLVGFQKRLEESELFTAIVLENMGIGEGGRDGKQPESKYRMAFKLHCRLRLDKVFPEEIYGTLWRALKPPSK